VATLEAVAPARALTPLHRQPLFLRFWAAQTVSVFGDQISALAIPLTAIFVLHASPLEVGVLGAMAWLPSLVVSLPAGLWIDARPHRRRVMIASDLLRAATLLTVPLLWWLDALTFWHLLAVTFTVGALSVFFDLANATFAIALIPRPQYVEAQGRLMTTRSLSYIAGPSTAGFLVQLFSAPLALLADAGTFLFSAFALRGTNVQEPPVEPTEETSLRRLGAAFRLLLGDSLLRGSLLCTSTINLFNFVLWGIFALFATRTLGLSAGTLGIVLGVGAVGALVGALIAPRVGRRIGIGRAVIVGAILFPVPVVLFALATGSHLVAGSMLLVGEFFSSVGVMVFDINQNAILTLAMPQALRSRLVAAYRFVNYGTRPVGALMGGVLGATIGLRETVWVSVVGSTLGVIFLFFSPMPRLREEDLT
jgi:predicted MFS family arabinose efflux permease